jgi:hypothetical protein
MRSDRPRYSNRPFPRYRFVPGETPHPRRHPHGHSFGQPEANPVAFEMELWRDSEIYAFGIDLFNFGYWWESHECFEALWKAFGRRTPEARFFQGLIQLAAAHLKRRSGNETAAIRLSTRSRHTLQGSPIRYMGLDIAKLIEDIERFHATPRGPAVSLRLDLSGEQPMATFKDYTTDNQANEQSRASGKRKP